VQIMQLAQLTGKDLAWTQNAVTSGKSVQAIQAELASERLSNAAPAVTTTIRNVVDRAADRPFASFGEQMVAIVQAGRPGGRVDPRLNRINASVSGANESVGSEGGFFVDSQLLPGVSEPVYAEDPLLARVTQIPIGAGFNGVKYNVVDETSRATGSRYGGVQGYWVAEADTATAKKPKLRRFELNLKKLMAISYLTEELMQDGVAAEGLITRAFQNELRFLLADAVWRGNGAGQPLGFLNGPATVSVAIESAQTIANTGASISMNTAKMLARIPADLKAGAIFLYNQELLPYLANATLGSTGIPVFMAGQTFANGPQDTIWGKPAFASEFCSAVGTVGDIVCIVPSEYHMTSKGGVNQAISAHVRFLYDEMALKFTYRADGAPVWSSALTPFKGSNSLSPYVTLATRS
jgi:HK97 family phage major capsid protein